MNRIFAISAILLSTHMTSCGPEDGDSAKVKLAVANSTSTSLNLTATNSVVPSYFGVKVFSVSLRKVADPTDSSASPEYESGIYVAPSGCSNGGKSDVERDGKKYEYYQPPGPDACTVSEMVEVDFARATEVVNEELAAGDYPVVPGEYNQATICWMSVYGLAVEGHIENKVAVDTTSPTTTSSGCVDTVLEGFTVSEGESATVRLDYDLADNVVTSIQNIGAYADGLGTGCAESETEEGTYFCINGLNPTPIGVK